MKSPSFYQVESRRLEELIKSINRPGEFCTYGRVGKPMPRLEVEDIGILSFPVPKTQVEDLIKFADQAPYGKGSQTLVDVSVRNCWEINADGFSLGGRNWENTIDHFSELAAKGLGCPRESIHAELYKLLIYETGGFFIPHRDTEKSDGMIATLTISLPVAGTGGELVVRHRHKEMTIEMNVDDPSELAYAAFYADCKHEIKKVRSGHRIALIYNLCVEPGDVETRRDAPDYTREVDAIAAELIKWCSNEDSGDKLVWILEHAYSQAGLSFNMLKNGDWAVANALRKASEQADCDLYAAILHITEFYDAYYVGGGYYYDDHSEDDYEIGELIEGKIWMDSWASPDGRNPSLGEIPIGACELMPAGVLDDADPSYEDFEEATGNAGATLDRAYHFAALALLKRARILNTLVQTGPINAVAWIDEELARNDNCVDDRITGLVEKLVEIWPDKERCFGPSGISTMLHLLSSIKNPRISMQFLRKIAIHEYRGEESSWLMKVLLELESVEIAEVLRSLIRKKFSSYSEELLQFIVKLNDEVNYPVDTKRRLFRKCAEEILKKLPETLPSIEKKLSYRYSSESTEFGTEAIKNLFRICWFADAMDIALAVTEVIAQYPKVVSLDRSVPKMLLDLSHMHGFSNSEAYFLLWNISSGYLLYRSSTPPTPPKDWRISTEITCSGQHCENLRRFCEDPRQKIARFSVRRDLRNHIRSTIDSLKLDIDYETERKGSPYTLICTKNRASYLRRLEEYEIDIDHMINLIETAPTAERSTYVDEDLARLQDAVTHLRNPRLNFK